MVDQIIEYFREKNTFKEFRNIEFNLLNFVFASPQQVFGIVLIDDNDSLKEIWEKASEEFAVRIQSQLMDSLYYLKWDMYLVLIINSDLDDLELCKYIENDRMYFKKIVLAKNLGDFQRKLPIELKLGDSDHLEVFSDRQYLDELRKVVSEDIINRLDFNLYENKSIELANDEIFLNPYKSEGVQK